MSSVVGVFETVHTPFCYLPPERWNDVRARRDHRADVPMEDLETQQKKSARIQAALGTLRDKVAQVKPDVLVVIGDDQLECFDFNAFPAMAIYVGAEFEGNLSGADSSYYGEQKDASETPRAKLKGHPELAVSLLTGLMRRGFDPAFCMDMPKPEIGVGHAILRPAESITDMQTPIVPLLLNCYFAPQPTATRCYEMGKAIRQCIDEHDGDLRVGIVGSGGLWHTPGEPQAFLDEEFDAETLRLIAKGDVRGMADLFDGYEVAADDRSQQIAVRGKTITGMPGTGGPQGGTREICNWIAAAAVVEGEPFTIVDYIPVYASPIGAGFAYWTAN